MGEINIASRDNQEAILDKVGEINTKINSGITVNRGTPVKVETFSQTTDTTVSGTGKGTIMLRRTIDSDTVISTVTVNITIDGVALTEFSFMRNGIVILEFSQSFSIKQTHSRGSAYVCVCYY